MEKFNIVCVESQPEIADSFCRAVEVSLKFRCVACYTSAEEALQNLDRDQARIYLVALALPGLGGVDFIQKAKSVCKDSDFIVHSSSENEQDLVNAFSVGAVGYILKGISDEQLLAELEIVCDGGASISPKMARRLIDYFHVIGPQKKKLTRTETDVLNRLRDGMTYDQIAEIKHVSRSTVQTHIKNIYKKLNVNNRVDAVRAGVLFGMIE